MPQYGTFDMPSLLAYPEIKPIEQVPSIIGLFCYAVESYEPSYCCLIKRHGGEAGITLGDWDGNHAASEGVLKDKVPKLLKLMSHVGLEQAQFFFSSSNQLVDVQLSLNKFIGPGMLRDLFNGIVPVQRILAIDTMTPEKIEEMSGNSIILKPSRFRYYEVDGVITPLYARI